jgi:hypothetical protein
MTQPKPIKASLNFKKVAPGDVLARANAVLNGVYSDKDAYPATPIDQATFKSQIDALSAGITVALDGGKKAIAARNHLNEVVIKSLRSLGHYVEENCKDDMPTFLKSGFVAQTTARTPAPPLSAAFRKIVAGKNSGQLLVTLMAIIGALSYELRWAALVGPAGTPGNWTNQPVGKIKPATVVNGLTPGTAYAFQARAVTNSGYTDWSESVTRIAT